MAIINCSTHPPLKSLLYTRIRRTFLSNFFEQNWFFTWKTNLIFDRNLIKLSFFCNLLNRMQFTLTSIMSATDCEDFRQITQNTLLFLIWVRVNWDKFYTGLLCSCSTALNWLIFNASGQTSNIFVLRIEYFVIAISNFLPMPISSKMFGCSLQPQKCQ